MNEAWAIMLTICSAIVTISSAATAIIVWVTKAKAPSVKLNDRVNTLERRVEKIEQHQHNDNERLKAQDDANRITQQALLAIMNYLINGTEADKEKLVAMRDKLQEFLIER